MSGPKNSSSAQAPSTSGPTRIPEEVGIGVAIAVGLGLVWWWGGGQQVVNAKLVMLEADLRAWVPRLITAGVVLATLAGAIVFLRVSRWAQRRIARRILHVFEEMRITTRKGEAPKLKAFRRRGRWVYELAFQMPATVSSRLMAQIQPNLQEYLDIGVKVWADRGLMWLRVGTHRMPELIEYREFRQEVEREQGELPVAVGVSREGPLVVDLAEVPHLLVGGTTGGGKSVFLNNLILTLVGALSPERLGLVLIDLKGGLEFWRYRDLPHLLCPVVCDVRAVVQALGSVLDELDRRYPAFREAGCEQLGAWNRLHPDRQLPYIVLVVDELAEVTAKGSTDAEEQARRKQVVAALGTIGRMGRALGIHLVLCTQRPDAEVLPGQIKGQMGATIAFRARDMIQSEVLLGQGDVTAAMLPQEAKGRAYFKGSEEGVMVQTPLVRPPDAEVIVRRIVSELGDRNASTARWPALVPAPAEVAERASAKPLPRENDRPPEQPRKLPRPYDVSRLRVGIDYEIELRDGRRVRGTVRDTAYPQGQGGANADGQHPLRLQDQGRDQWLSFYEIAGVRRCAPVLAAKNEEERTG
jgi:hypothetical protein